MTKYFAKNIRNFTLRMYIHLFLLLLVCAGISAQPNTEAIARLHYSVMAQSNNWIEGYQSYRSGSYSPYQSHRSGMNRDSAFVARTAGGESMIEWYTAPVPKSWKGDTASFIWVCGFGNNLGNEWYDCTVNDSVITSFPTVNDGAWSVYGAQGIKLSFTAVSQNSHGANLGYMVLSIPRLLVTKGNPVKIRIRGREVKEEIWYRVYPYRDAVSYLMKQEARTYFSNVEFIHMGDAKYLICAPKKYSDASVQLFNTSTLIAEGRLTSEGLLSKAMMSIPRHLQPDNNVKTVVTIAGKAVDTISWKEIYSKRIRAFMDEEIIANKYVFYPGDFPKLHWENEIMVENELGKFPLTATYYNDAFQKVTSADAPGRYGAIIEGVTPAGAIIKRYVTLYCTKVRFDEYSNTVPLKINKLRDYGISDIAWDRYEKNDERFSFGSMKYFPVHDPHAAIFLAGLRDLDSANDAFDTPRIADRQWWITLKRNLYAKSSLPNPLTLPQKINGAASTLLNDTLVVSTGYESDKIEKLRTICRTWGEKGGVPHVTVVVHKGKIIFYDAFGQNDDGTAAAKNSPMWMASITKLLTGVLMMEFVDQGIIDLDAPIGRYLSELDGIADNKLTIRHLLTHTSGLYFAGEWASDWDNALENQIAHVLPTVDVGGSFAYNRVGYAITAKIMERITGRAVPYLFRDYVFAPLNMKSAFSDNTYGGLYCSALDLAHLGQMLLNRGTYNGYSLFSSQSFEKMLPRKLPIGDRRWGIGTSPVEGNGLSASAFGHGAASGAVFCIDPGNDLIIISARNKVGKYHDEFENQLIESCSELVRNH